MTVTTCLSPTTYPLHPCLGPDVVQEGAEVPARRPPGAGGGVVGIEAAGDAAGVAGGGAQFPGQAPAPQGPTPGASGHGNPAPGGKGAQGAGALSRPKVSIGTLSRPQVSQGL